MGRASRLKRARRAGLLPEMAPHPSRFPQANAAEDERKISAALAELIDPYQDDARTFDQYRVLVSIGATAWNLAVLPEGERDRSFEEAIEDLDVPDPRMFRRLVSELISRKERLFPEDRRLIVSYDISTIPTGYYLTVAAERAV